MGFTYAVINGKERLCCDFCDAYRGDENNTKWVRRIKCPHGWCQPHATCNNCFSVGKYKKINHESCKKQSNIYHAEKQKEITALESGKYVRRSAIGHEDNVKVLFSNKDGEEKAFMMHTKVYNSIPLGITATIEDYQQIGVLEECASLDLMVAA